MGLRFKAMPRRGPRVVKSERGDVMAVKSEKRDIMEDPKNSNHGASTMPQRSRRMRLRWKTRAVKLEKEHEKTDAKHDNDSSSTVAV